MNYNTIRKEMIADEGIKNRIYICPAGKLSIGIGRNLENVDLTEAEIDFMFKTDFDRVCADLGRLFPDFKKWPEELQNIFFNMRFQLGPKGFRNFTKLIDAANRLDLACIEREMENSKWAKVDTPARAKRLVDRVRKLRTG